MASSGNFPLWSPLIKDSTNLSQGNTRFTGATNNRGAMTSFAIPSGTKFYVELLVKQANFYNIVFGIANPEFNLATYDESDASLNGFIFSGYNNNDWRTNPLVNGSRQGWNLLSDDTTSLRVMALTINRVDNEIKCYFDNTLITNGTISISATETYHLVCAFAGGANANIHMNINGGHDSTGAGDFSAGSATDENGFGEFQNTPPTGFLALCSANLPISDDIDPAQTDDDYPQKNFNVVTYDSTGSGQSITGVGFQPDLVWIKCRSDAQGNGLFDSTRGTSKVLESNSTAAENTSSGVTSFDSDGYSMGTYYNQSGRQYVSWCWRANGGVTSSNSDGTITSTVQANTAAGFSIVKFTGDGNSNATVGHGLNSAPDLIMCKPYGSGTLSWHVFHRAMGTGEFILNTDSAFDTRTTSFTESGTTATNFNLGSNAGSMNYSGNDTIAYCWHSVEGYSKFGKYEGNSNADGTFVYTGFRPRMLFTKNADGVGGWRTRDTARSVNNPTQRILWWDLTQQEYSNSAYSIDILSNGFKLRTSSGDFNASNTWVYGAWGDVPFKYNNTF